MKIVNETEFINLIRKKKISKEALHKMAEQANKIRNTKDVNEPDSYDKQVKVLEIFNKNLVEAISKNTNLEHMVIQLIQNVQISQLKIIKEIKEDKPIIQTPKRWIFDIKRNDGGFISSIEATKIL